ncbi:MAG: MFS transporter [Vulcanimicrobiota bacterium]
MLPLMVPSKAPKWTSFREPAFVRLLLANLLVITGSTCFVMLPAILEDQGLRRWHIGLGDAAFWMASVLIQPWLAGVLDRFPKQFFYLPGCLGMSLAAAGYIWAPFQPLPVWCLRGLQGTGFALYVTATLAWLGERVPGAGMGRFLGIFGLTGMLGGLLGSGLSEFVWLTYGRRPLFFCAAVILLVGWVWLLTLPDLEPERPQLRATDSWSGPGAARLALAAWAFGLAVGSLFAFTTPFLRSLGVTGISGLFAGLFLMSAAARVGCGYWLDLWGPLGLVAPSLALLAVGALLMAVLPGLSGARVAGFLLSGACSGVGYGAIYPALKAQAYQSFPSENRGAALSLVKMAIDLGCASGSLLAGFLASWLGYPVTFTILGLLVFLLSMVVARLNSRMLTAP